MKNKIFLLFFLFLVGCNLNNTAISKVEEKLSNYNMTDKTVNDDIERAILLITDNNNNLSVAEKQRYKKLVEKQFKNLVYEIKDDEIDGDNAIITVEIKVTNFKIIMDKYGVLNDEAEVDSLLDELEKTKDKIIYTIDFYVVKKNNEWELVDIDNITFSKIMGVYQA